MGPGLSTALSIGGSLLGGLGGGGKQKPITTPTAFGQQPKENQEALQKQLEDYFINAKYRDFFGRPTRRMGLGDIDGDFTPKALFDIQNYFDQQAAAQPQQAPQQSSPSNVDLMKAMALLQEVQQSNAIAGGGYQGRQMKPMSQIDEDALMALASQLDGAQVGGGTQSGVLFGKGNKPIDLTRFYA